jgi:chemotaxis family two-component system response regulator Rcp1
MASNSTENAELNANEDREESSASAGQPSPLLRRRASGPQTAINILLIDDDADCRLLIRDAITESKVSNAVFEVANGKEAMDFLLQQGEWSNAPRPGLIYLDIEMPGMSGLDVLRAIKANSNLRDIPVVMMTGVTDEAQMRQAAEAGANSYTIKPASADHFLKTVVMSTKYWLTIHQYPDHHIPSLEAKASVKDQGEI